MLMDSSCALKKFLLFHVIFEVVAGKIAMDGPVFDYDSVFGLVLHSVDGREIGYDVARDCNTMDYCLTLEQEVCKSK